MLRENNDPYQSIMMDHNKTSKGCYCVTLIIWKYIVDHNSKSIHVLFFFFYSIDVGIWVLAHNTFSSICSTFDIFYRAFQCMVDTSGYFQFM